LRITFIEPVGTNWTLAAPEGVASELAGEASARATAVTATASSRLTAVSFRRPFVIKRKLLAPNVSSSYADG
jgi:hypothetical protein